MSQKLIDIAALEDACARCLQTLMRVLEPIYDTHHVCAEAAATIQRVTGVATCFILENPQQSSYMLWLATSEAQTQQSVARDDLAPLLTAPRLGSSELVVYKSDPRDVERGLHHGERVSGWLNSGPIIGKQLYYASPAQVAFPGSYLFWHDPPQPLELSGIALASLAALVAAYVGRAELMGVANRQLILSETLQEVNQLLASKLNVAEIFESVNITVRALVVADEVRIGQIDPRSGELVYIATTGTDVSLLEQLDEPNAMAKQAVATGKAQQRTMSGTGEEADSVSEFCAPLVVEGRVTGVLQVVAARRFGFNAYERQLIEGFVPALAVALETARLYGVAVADRARMETLIDNLGEGIMTVDRDGYITQANAMFQTMMRRHEESLIGKSADAIVRTTSHTFATIMERIRVAAFEDSVSQAIELHVDDETIPVLLSGAAIPDADGLLSEYVFVFSDLRDLREIERMRDDFFHNIVHELRTPVATLLMYVRLLRSQSVLDDTQRRYVDMLERTSDRLQLLVREMLEVQKLEGHRLEETVMPVDVNRLLDEIMPPLALLADQKGISFTPSIEPDLPLVFADPRVLYSMIKNIAENAVKFTFEGGVRIRVMCRGDDLSVRVSDDGIGIDASALPKLFGRFYRSRNAVERGIAGSGLGLYMVKRGVDMHGGSIVVDSTEGEGTMVQLNIPIDRNRPPGHAKKV